MTFRGKIVFLVFILLITGIVFLIFKNKKEEVVLPQQEVVTPSLEESALVAIKEVVSQFGNRMKNVSLTGDSDTLKQSIENEYSKFVSPLLLKRWLDDPLHAPGRTTSSPWPETIEIIDMYKSGDYYDVTGEIILWTSKESASGEGDAGREPIFLTLIQEKGKWLIAEYQTSME